jgi:hypothetical protein
MSTIRSEDPKKKKGKAEEKSPVQTGGMRWPDDLMKKMPADLLEEIAALQVHEKKILEALKNEKLAKRYLVDPAAVLRELKIPLPPNLKHRLKMLKGLEDITRPRTFTLPSGQQITPRVRVRFTR